MSNRPISTTDTPDPWMVAAHGIFYLTFTAGDRVELWSSPMMEDFHRCTKSIIWRPQPNSPWSVDLWAPELHYLNGTWYVYLCGGHPGKGNPSHRTLLLRSSSQNPMEPAAWNFLGPLKGLPDHWNIDATVFSPAPHRLFCVYSGWPLGDHSDTQQDLFLIEMASPEVAISESLTCISRAELPWERPDGGRRGVNEGPTWLSIPGFQGIVYSANGSWTSDYKLGILRLEGDPRNPNSWKKRPTPLLESNVSKGGPFGPGHASFIPSPYGDGRAFCIYHATSKPDEGWNNRKARVLCLSGEQFHEHATTMCCANGGFPNNSLPRMQQTVGPQTGNQANNWNSRPASKRASLLEKVEDKLKQKLRGL